MTEDANKILEETETVYEEVQDHLRPAAEFFHENEGELFTRSEAVNELEEKLDISSRIANNILGQLVGDTVDPIVQVTRGSDKFVGVVDFQEFGGAYGYLEYDDVIGPRKRVVCQQCVNAAVSDQEVTHATEKSRDSSSSTFNQEADYDELLEKVHAHYEQAHDVVPEEVETGATLASGTTIGGNTAWHDGNSAHDNTDHSTDMATATELDNHAGNTGAHHAKTTSQADLTDLYSDAENIYVQSTEPASPQSNDLWIDTS